MNLRFLLSPFSLAVAALFLSTYSFGQSTNLACKRAVIQGAEAQARRELHTNDPIRVVEVLDGAQQVTSANPEFDFLVDKYTALVAVGDYLQIPYDCEARPNSRDGSCRMVWIERSPE